MAKKRAATGAAKKVDKKADEQQIELTPQQEKALKLVDKSAKVRSDLEQAVVLAAAKAVRKVMKDQGIELSMDQAGLLTTVWFGD